MGKIDTIKRAIEDLPPAEVDRLRQWIEELHERQFDERIARDAKAGKLDALIAEAKAEHTAGNRDEL
jgi:hypothetical protein